VKTLLIGKDDVTHESNYDNEDEQHREVTGVDISVFTAMATVVMARPAKSSSVLNLWLNH
jgi:hypothetical protein